MYIYRCLYDSTHTYTWRCNSNGYGEVTRRFPGKRKGRLSLVHALCLMPYVLCLMPLVPRSMERPPPRRRVSAGAPRQVHKA